ncbi:hypothetical protein N9F39_02545 [Akkermansiaceae bacterium]|nr:hypothetical protein [Akkermansiaceae bacterium]
MSNKRGRKKGVSDFVYITPSILEEVIKVAEERRKKRKRVGWLETGDRNKDPYWTKIPVSKSWLETLGYNLQTGSLTWPYTPDDFSRWRKAHLTNEVRDAGGGANSQTWGELGDFRIRPKDGNPIGGDVRLENMKEKPAKIGRGQQSGETHVFVPCSAIEQLFFDRVFYEDSYKIFSHLEKVRLKTERLILKREKEREELRRKTPIGKTPPQVDIPKDFNWAALLLSDFRGRILRFVGKINSLKETLEDEAENFDSVEIKFASAKGASPQLSDIPVITLLSFVYLTEGMAGDFTLREVKQFIGRRKKITKAPFKTSWVKSLGERVPPEWVYEVDYWPPDREYLGRKRDKVSEEVQAMPWSMRELFMWEPQYDAYVSKAQTIDAEE